MIKEHKVAGVSIAILKDNGLMFEKNFGFADLGNKFSVQSQGRLLNMQMKGEKINPQSIVRKYEVEFEKEISNWIFIFFNREKNNFDQSHVT